jgi:prepilin-type processing-associated H-X9-DG protein
MFQVQPNVNGCDPATTQSAHASGMNIALADGSVRLVTAGMSLTTWQNALRPRDGAPLGNDW